MKHLKNLMLVGMLLSLSCLLMVVSGSRSWAAVSGPCSSCHTMHDSQGGVDVGGAGTFNTLLLDSCIGCHTTTGSDPLDDVDLIPYIAGIGFDNDNCLAGGFFTDTSLTSTDNHSDENHSLGSEVTPAGYSGTFYEGDAAGNGLTCAGATGCHGNETSILNDEEAIKGGHHDTGQTYRMLYVGTNPVAGTGTADFEEELINVADPNTTTSTLNHNIYSAGAGDVTISELCGKCHGNFHVQGTSPFVRHPTDVDIPTDWEIVDGTGQPSSSYTDADRKYNPLGFAGGASETNTGRATCVSCHRAHGSAENDILRFDYTTQQAGGGNDYGCLGCHSLQR